MAKSQKWLEERLVWALFFARWAGGYPQVIWAAGVRRAPFFSVALWTLVCDAVWAAFWVLASVRAADWARRTPGWTAVGIFLFLAAAAAGLVLILGPRRRPG